MKEGGGGIGNGASSIILVFAVLCLTIFALITLSSATSEKNLSRQSLNMIKDYYAADTMAEEIVAELMSLESLPEKVQGIEISQTAEDSGTRVGFLCPVSDSKELKVELMLADGEFEVLVWKMRDTREWAPSSPGNLVFPGF